MSFTTHDKLLLAGLLPTEASHGRLRRLLDQERAQLDWAAIARRANFHFTAALLRLNLARIGALDLVPAAFRHELDEAAAFGRSGFDVAGGRQG